MYLPGSATSWTSPFQGSNITMTFKSHSQGGLSTKFSRSLLGRTFLLLDHLAHCLSLCLQPCTLSFSQDKVLFSFRSPLQILARFSCSISELDTPNLTCQDHRTPCSDLFIQLFSPQRCWLPKCNLPGNWDRIWSTCCAQDFLLQHSMDEKWLSNHFLLLVYLVSVFVGLFVWLARERQRQWHGERT